jgi:hypothetical protein
MKVLVPLLIAAVAFGGARFARKNAAQARVEGFNSPYVPSEDSVAFLSLGYRELAADILLVRMVGYFGSDDNDGKVIASLAEAITTLDPSYRRAYDVGAVAMTAARRGVDNSVHLRAIALLERAAKQFPSAYRYPNLAGQIYLVDLQTRDPAQRRKWDERGALLLESAARKPGAPADAAMQAAILQTRFGRQQRAIDQLREILLITSDPKSRDGIIQKLAELQGQDAAAISAELSEARNRFLHVWLRDRPTIPQSMYILIGARIAPTFDLTDLAAGGNLIESEVIPELIQPLEDEAEP